MSVCRRTFTASPHRAKHCGFGTLFFLPILISRRWIVEFCLLCSATLTEEDLGDRCRQAAAPCRSDCPMHSGWIHVWWWKKIATRTATIIGGLQSPWKLDEHSTVVPCGHNLFFLMVCIIFDSSLLKGILGILLFQHVSYRANFWWVRWYFEATWTVECSHGLGVWDGNKSWAKDTVLCESRWS